EKRDGRAELCVHRRLGSVPHATRQSAAAQSPELAASRRKRAFASAEPGQRRSYATAGKRLGLLSASSGHLHSLPDQLELAARGALRIVILRCGFLRERCVRYAPLTHPPGLSREPGTVDRVHSDRHRIRKIGRVAAQQLVPGRFAAAKHSLPHGFVCLAHCRLRCYLPLARKENCANRDLFGWLTADLACSAGDRKMAAGRKLCLRVASAVGASGDGGGGLPAAEAVRRAASLLVPAELAGTADFHSAAARVLPGAGAHAGGWTCCSPGVRIAFHFPRAADGSAADCEWPGRSVRSPVGG